MAGNAKKEHGVFRVKPGQIIPEVHLIGLADQPFFIAPMKRVRTGHRSLGPTEFESRSPLGENEFALEARILVEIVQDPAQLAAARRLDSSAHIPGVNEPSTLFSIPAKFLFSPRTWPKKAYVLYQHIFGDGPS